MTLKKLMMRNYRCFKDFEVRFDDRLTLIVGVNGSGKTSVLEGAAVALGAFFAGFDGLPGRGIAKRDARLEAYQMGAADDTQAQYPVEITAEGMIDDGIALQSRQIRWTRSLNSGNGSTTIKNAKPMVDLAKTYQQRMRSGDRDLVLPIIAYYGTGRLWDYHREKKSDIFKDNTKINGYVDSLDGTANVKLMMNWFRKKTVQAAQKKELGLDAPYDLEAVYSAMGSCLERITGYEGMKLSYNLDTNEIDCCYKGKEGLVGKMPISQMSDGYKCTISLIADIAYRMAVLNPQLGVNVLGETDGIILIDEIDLHLHPAWQQRILSDLMEIFPKVQFIATTHAPAVISSAKSENLVILKDCEVADATSETFGNDANSILKGIMGVSERIPSIAGLFGRFDSLLNEGNYDEAEKILDEIDQQRDFHDKEVVADRVKLSLERIRGGQK